MIPEGDGPDECGAAGLGIQPVGAEIAQSFELVQAYMFTGLENAASYGRTYALICFRYI